MRAFTLPKLEFREATLRNYAQCHWVLSKFLCAALGFLALAFPFLSFFSFSLCLALLGFCCSCFSLHLSLVLLLLLVISSCCHCYVFLLHLPPYFLYSTSAVVIYVLFISLHLFYCVSMPLSLFAWMFVCLSAQIFEFLWWWKWQVTLGQRGGYGFGGQRGHGLEQR